MNNRKYQIAAFCLFIVFCITIFSNTVSAAVVEKNGSFLTMISGPNVYDSVAGEICGFRMYYNTSTNRMDENSEIIIDENSSYIYTTEFKSNKYTDDKCVKLIKCAEDINSFKQDVVEKLMDEESSEISLEFLYSLKEEDFKEYDVLAYAEVYYGAYGNFSVLKSIEEGNDNIVANLITMNAMEKYYYGYEDIRIMVFGGMVPIVRYYIIPKDRIIEKDLEVLIKEEYLTDESQSNLFCEVPWNQIEDSLYVRGDADGNGKINSKDALYVLKISVGMEQIDEKYIKYVDVTSDGKINSRDALKILQKAAGIIKNL